MKAEGTEGLSTYQAAPYWGPEDSGWTQGWPCLWSTATGVRGHLRKAGQRKDSLESIPRLPRIMASSHMPPFILTRRVCLLTRSKEKQRLSVVARHGDGDVARATP